ncbi:MAG: GMC family oxidoreductase N-terminal domain-containing protein [Actinobacteria bacterium]|nr:GMC family oxidoreductase N-terminal domain-containing protein [Actinomycetota bacterium]
MVDTVVVGAGSAGCVLASRLSEDAGREVLLLEAGGQDTRREIAIPAAFSKLFKSEVDWDYGTVPQEHLAGRSVYWPRGKVLGGSSSLNAMMAIPGSSLDWDSWAQLGAAGWAWRDAQPYLARAETTLEIEEQRDPNPLTLAFVEAAHAFGIHHCHLTPESLDGVRLTPVTERRGRRWSAADAYLRPALGRPNLTVETDAHVTRVLFEGGCAVGVEVVRGGRTETVRAGEVVLAGGAVNSPQLLLLSGVGPAEQLERHGIPLVHELRGVGAHLEDHLTGGILVSSTTGDSLYTAEKPLELLRWLLLRRGKLTSNVGEAAAFVRSRPDVPAPDVEILFAPVLFEEEGLAPPRGHGFTLGTVLLQPRSSGTVTLRSADPFDPPAIDPRYLSDPSDLDTLVRGIELARRLVAQEPLASLAGPELEPGDAPLDEFVRSRAQTLYHPVGTCRMGMDENAVVDPELRVRGIEGLRVVDASVMPHVPRGHTHLPTLAIAERAAELIRGRGAAASGAQPASVA